jgi:hypothetical protein
MDKPEALRLADALDAEIVRTVKLDVMHNDAAAELRRLHDLVAACEPYLKEGETPAERIERERGDTEAVCRLYAKEREKNVELLEAAKQVIAWYEAEDDHSKADFYQRLEMCRTSEAALRAAIAKAEGEPK